MRIGILTLQYGANYGGTLQCYALYKTLCELGHDVEVINFIPTIDAPKYKRLMYNLSMARSVKEAVSTIKRIFSHSNSKIIDPNVVTIFEEFRKKNIKLTELVNEISISKLNNRFEAIVVGSDQVWSSMVRSHLTYFGEWDPAFSGKLISYAACAYTNKYPYIRRKKIKTLINSFSAISVRDDLTKSLVDKFYKNQVSIVADPTLLYDFSAFATPAIINEPYILTYVLGTEILGGNNNAIRHVKEKLGIKKVVAITSYDTDISYADITLKRSSPEEWVNLIANASCVYTDSFHGVIFSLKFRRRFLAYYKDKLRASRLIDLQDRFRLNKNIVTQLEQIKQLSVEDFDIQDTLNTSINKLIKESKKFLITSL